MVLPLTLLSAGKDGSVLIELKNGEAYSGTLVSSDPFMNLQLSNVVCTSADGAKFWKMKDCFVRGIFVKYMRFEPSTVTKALAMPPPARGTARGGPTRGGPARGGAMRGGLTPTRGGANTRGSGETRGRGSARGGRGAPMSRGRGRGTSS